MLDAPNDPAAGGACTAEQQCAIGGNRLSKAACVAWEALGPDGRPTQHGGPPISLWATANETLSNETLSTFSWSLLNAPQPFPCAGEADASDCARDTRYRWPAGYAPASVRTPGADEGWSDVVLTRHGDPVDADSFYRTCGDSDVHQLGLVYEQAVFMTGFAINFDLRDDLRFRVIAKTARRYSEDVYRQSSRRNLTRETVYSDAPGAPAAQGA